MYRVFLVKKCFSYKSAQMSNFSRYSKSFSSFQEGFHYLALVWSMKLKKFSFEKILSKFIRFVYFLQNKNQVFKKFRLHSKGLFFLKWLQVFLFLASGSFSFLFVVFQYNNDSILFCFFEDCNTFSNYTLKFLFSLFCFCLLFKRFTVLQKSFFSSFMIYKIFVFFFVFTQFQHVTKKLF